MSKEEKELLLKDLCARLPYGVKAQYYGSEEAMLCVDTIEGIYPQENEIVVGQYGLPVEKVKPYLLPMESMTEKEIWEIDNMQTGGDFDLPNGEGLTWLPNPDICDYLNSIHVDYRGLIDKGLAIAVTEQNNPYKD